jgi:hypothetical protein
MRFEPSWAVDPKWVEFSNQPGPFDSKRMARFSSPPSLWNAQQGCLSNCFGHSNVILLVSDQALKACLAQRRRLLMTGTLMGIFVATALLLRDELAKFHSGRAGTASQHRSATSASRLRDKRHSRLVRARKLEDTQSVRRNHSPDQARRAGPEYARVVTCRGTRVCSGCYLEREYRMPGRRAA